jgi:hypothetical protein
MAPGNVLAAQLWVTHSVMRGAERCLDMCGKEAREPLPARGCREARERSNNWRGVLSRWASAHVREVMDAQVTCAFEQALLFRCDVAEQLPALAQLIRTQPPVLCGAAEPIDEVRQLGVIHGVNWLGVEVALRVLLRLLSAAPEIGHAIACSP